METITYIRQEKSQLEFKNLVIKIKHMKQIYICHFLSFLKHCFGLI